MDTIFSLPQDGIGGVTSPGNVSTSGCFQLCFNVIKTSRHWNQGVNVSLKAFYKRSLFHSYLYRVHARVRVHGPGSQCQVSSWVAFDFIYWSKVSHWIRSLSISQIGCPGSPLDPKTLLPTTEFLGSITPGFLHGCWESELRFSYFMLR